jgi:UDP-glucose 4-epimerase
VVFHLAAQVSNIKSFENPREDFTTNVLGTLNVLEMCERHGVPRLLYASSMAVYGEAGELPVGETSPCVPTSYYGISKHCAESYLLAASQNPLSRLKVTALRMFNVFGPLQSLTNPYQGVVSVFISNVISDQPVTIYGTGHQTRDFIYIDDIVRAWLLAIDNDAACNRAINLGSNTRVSVLELLTAVLEAAGKNGAPWPLRYEPRLFGDQDHIRCDNRLAGSLLGWQPQVSFLTGLQRTIRWAREGR